MVHKKRKSRLRRSVFRAKRRGHLAKAQTLKHSNSKTGCAESTAFSAPVLDGLRHRWQQSIASGVLPVLAARKKEARVATYIGRRCMCIRFVVHYTRVSTSRKDWQQAPKSDGWGRGEGGGDNWKRRRFLKSKKEWHELCPTEMNCAPLPSLIL